MIDDGGTRPAAPAGSTDTSPTHGEQVANFLRMNREEILSCWEQAVREFPAARAQKLGKLALRNSIPELLLRMADLIASGLDSRDVQARFPDPSPEVHAIERFKSGYELREVVAEYATLRKVVFETWSRREAGPGGPKASATDALQIINEVLDLAAMTAIAKFTRERERTLEALDRISRVALVADDLDAFAPELLRVLVDAAPSVHWAALLLRDGDRLTLRGQVGLDADAVKDFSVAIGEGFAGRVAAEGRPILLRSTGHDDVPPDSTTALVSVADQRTLYGVPLQNGGELLGVAFMGSRDALEFPEGEQELLRALAVRASALLVQKKLIRSLEEAARRKDEFLAMLAHELRNPLAPIRTAVAFLRFPGLGEGERARAHAVIDRQSSHLARLVDDLLEVSRITRGRIELRKEPLDSASVVAHAVEVAKPLMEARNHTLTVEVPAVAPWLMGDPARLAQVLGNLLSNAAKFTDPGGQIQLTLSSEAADVVFRVRDSGVGIPQDMLEKVFDLFVQVDTTLDRAQGGLGIGLTLVRSLVELHGGSVAAYSQGRGKGCEFVVRLPELRRISEAQAPGHRKTAEGAEAASARVLVVDDNGDLAQTLAEFLTLLGYAVKTAADGATALEVARSFEPAVVVLDIGLPHMSGYDVARRLREEHGQRLVLVAMTGYGQNEDRRLAFAAGFDHHLVKPVDPNDLHQLLSRVRHQR